MIGSLDTDHKRLAAALDAATSAPDAASTLAFASAARKVGRTDLGISLLNKHLLRAPDDANIAFALAQLRYESGLESAALFQGLWQSAPGDLRLAAATASALGGEGEREQAEALLEHTLAVHPDWIEGHKALAALRWTAGAPVHAFARSFGPACKAQPQNRALRLAWFQTLAQAKAWDAARQIIADGERLMGSHTGFTLASLYIASESGDDRTADALFAQTETWLDAGLELCRIRYGLRHQRYAWAEQAATRLLHTAAAQQAWPYLSLIWRAQNNPRAAWLDAPDATIKVYDLGFSEAESTELAQILRTLHTARAPYLDQSVRGGTQTDRPLFLRHEPILVQTKARITEAVAAYVAALPAPDPDHPLLGAPRDAALCFSGSWSIRLSGRGFHVAHTHPMGWISSSFYAALPSPDALGPAPAGWISFGMPPPECALSLKPYTRIEPKVGRLVLFPSTMWHSTEPYETGERLVIAFDVARPSV